ncbi:MAG: nitrous oxidase accessory protein NosD, partial [Myxococcota bacterium]
MPLLSRGGAILCALPFCASADVVFREDGFGTQAADQSWEFVYQGESGGWHHESDAALLTGSARGRWSASAQTEVEGQPGEPVWLGMRSGGGCSRGDIEAGLSASRDGGVTWERIAEATNFDPATGALGVLARISDAGAGTIRIRLEFSSDNGAGCQLALHSATFINGHAPVAHVWGPFDVDGPDQQWLVTLLDADGDAVTLTPVGSSALAILGTTAGAIPGATDLVLQLRGDPPAGCTEFSVLASSGMLSTMLSGILDPPGVSCVEGHREALLVSTGEVVALTPGDPGAMARIPAFRPAGMSRRWPTLRGSRTTVRLLDPLDTDVCPGPVPVSGQIWPINGLSEVVVNGAPVPVAADGTFASWTNVQGMGQQTIVVAGIDAASVVTSASRVITVNPCPSKPEIEPCIAELAGGSTAALTHCSGVSWSFEAPMLGRIAGSTTLALASLTRADGIDGITGVVVEGLLPQTTYRILKGGFFNSTDMVSDDFGKLQFSAALGALPRALWLQVVPATIQIDGTPASCFAAGGLPNAGTCHMNGKHLTDAVQITSGTLDCGGGNIQGQGFGVGVEVQHTNGAIIRNCQITNWELGAWVHGSANVRFEMSEITNVVAGLFVDDTTDFRLTDSTVLSGTDASLFSIGISIANTDLVDVTSVEVSGFTFGITARLSPGLVVSTTTVDSAAVGVVLAKTPGARLEEVDVKATAFGVRLSGEDDPACAVELAGVTLEAWPPDGNHSFIAADIVGCPDFHLGELGSGIFSRVFDGLVVVGSSPNARIDRTRFEGDGHPSVVEMLRIGIGSDGATVGPFVSVDGAFAAGVVSQASDVSIDDVTVTGPWQAKPGESTGAAPFSVGILVNGYPTSTPGSQSGESGPPAAQQANRLTDIDVSGVGTGVYIVGASGTEITDASIHDNAVVGVRLGGVL